MKLIRSILNRRSVRRTGHVLPRTDAFADAGERNQENLVRILNALLNKCARLLLPNDGKEGRALLIKAAINSSTFRRYSLPSRNTENQLKYQQFAKNGSIACMKAMRETRTKVMTNQMEAEMEICGRKWISILIR